MSRTQSSRSRLKHRADTKQPEVAIPEDPENMIPLTEDEEKRAKDAIERYLAQRLADPRIA